MDFLDESARVLVSAFSREFFGYGNHKAPIWFIGLEEGGGEDLKEVWARIATWDRLGRPALADAAVFHEGFGQDRWFLDRAPTQSTWRELIRSILKATNQPHDIESIRRYQISEFARSDSCVALLEALPMPNPSMNQEDWRYGAWSSIPFLRSRREYKAELLPLRIKKIQAMVNEYRPRLVAFYGLAYREDWSSVAGTHLEGSLPAIAEDSSGTSYALLPHPTARRRGGVDPWKSRKWLDLLSTALSSARP